jgi:hypothetical protein
MVNMRREWDAPEKRVAELGLTEEELAFYDAVRDNYATLYEEPFLRDLVHDVVQVVKGNLKVDWDGHRDLVPDAAGVADHQVQADGHLQRRRPAADGHRVPQGDERRVSGAPSRGVRRGLAAGERVDLVRLQEAGDELDAPWA